MRRFIANIGAPTFVRLARSPNGHELQDGNQVKNFFDASNFQKVVSKAPNTNTRSPSTLQANASPVCAAFEKAPTQRSPKKVRDGRVAKPATHRKGSKAQKTSLGSVLLTGALFVDRPPYIPPSIVGSPVCCLHPPPKSIRPVSFTAQMNTAFQLVNIEMTEALRKHVFLIYGTSGSGTTSAALHLAETLCKTRVKQFLDEERPCDVFGLFLDVGGDGPIDSQDTPSENLATAIVNAICSAFFATGMLTSEGCISDKCANSLLDDTHVVVIVDEASLYPHIAKWITDNANDPSFGLLPQKVLEGLRSTFPTHKHLFAGPLAFSFVVAGTGASQFKETRTTRFPKQVVRLRPSPKA